MSTYSKDTWPWEIVKVLRDAQRAGNSAGMTEADILLVIANTITSRGNIKDTKRKVPSYLNTLRSQLEINKCGMFEKVGCLYPDCKPKQQLWRLVPNAQTENIPDVEEYTFVSYADIDLERYQLSEASAYNIRESENVPVAKTRGEKRARGGDDDAGDARNTARARLETPEGGVGDDAKEAAAQVAAAQEAAARAAAAEAAKAKEAAAHEAAAKDAAAKEATAQEAAAMAAAAEAAKTKDAAAQEAAAAASRKRTAESLEEERRVKVAKEAKDARVREAQEKLRTLRREKDERHPRAAAVGGSGPNVGGSSAASVAASGAASGSSEALEARRLWEADAAWWSKHGPKAVDPDSGKRRLFTKTSPDSRWHFTEVQTSFPNGFVYVAEDRVVDEARRRGVLGMPADAAHLLARKINKDTAIFLCRVSVSSERDNRDKHDRMPRLDLDVYGASEPYRGRAEKGAPPVAVDASFFGGRLPAQIKIHKRRCFGAALRDNLGSAAVSGGLVDLRGVSFKTEQKLKRAESLMPVLLKNAKRTDALVAELCARAREAVRAKRGFP